MVQRLVILGVLAVAFIGMASVFAPQRSKAGDGTAPRHEMRATPANKRVERGSDSIEPQSRPSAPAPQTNPLSVNPHEGLRSLGTLEGSSFIVHIYSTVAGPRYSIYARADGTEMGVLLSVDQVHQLVPELQLPATDFSAPGTLMMAEPDAAWTP
jgi:hypothetical protein